MTAFLKQNGEFIYRAFTFLVQLLVLVAGTAFALGALPSKFATKSDAQMAAVSTVVPIQQAISHMAEITTLRDNETLKAIESAVAERNMMIFSDRERIKKVEDAMTNLVSLDKNVAVMAQRMDDMNAKLNEVKERLPRQPN